MIACRSGWALLSIVCIDLTFILKFTAFLFLVGFIPFSSSKFSVYTHFFLYLVRYIYVYFPFRFGFFLTSEFGASICQTHCVWRLDNHRMKKKKRKKTYSPPSKKNTMSVICSRALRLFNIIFHTLNQPTYTRPNWRFSTTFLSKSIVYIVPNAFAHKVTDIRLTRFAFCGWINFSFVSNGDKPTTISHVEFDDIKSDPRLFFFIHFDYQDVKFFFASIENIKWITPFSVKDVKKKGGYLLPFLII